MILMVGHFTPDFFGEYFCFDILETGCAFPVILRCTANNLVVDAGH